MDETDPLHPSTLDYISSCVRCYLAGNVDKSELYGLINEVLIFHKFALGSRSYIIFPQLRLLWKPASKHSKKALIPDFGIGRYTTHGRIRLQGGVEAKPPVSIMLNLPDPTSLEERHPVLIRDEYQRAILQASDQVKAAIKNKVIPPNTTIPWIVSIGPYFIIRNFGPYNADHLSTRGHRPNDSGDAPTLEALQQVVANASNVPLGTPIYLFGTAAAGIAMQDYLSSGLALYDIPIPT
ncbi:hypothetical protein C0995_013064 [Termitomyces sp. Mi166|nr:hypothetical protein C0995_013064 [Termitomyces sp. Mi166\